MGDKQYWCIKYHYDNGEEYDYNQTIDSNEYVYGTVEQVRQYLQKSVFYNPQNVTSYNEEVGHSLYGVDKTRGTFSDTPFDDDDDEYSDYDFFNSWSFYGEKENRLYASRYVSTRYHGYYTDMKVWDETAYEAYPVTMDKIVKVL